MSRHRQRPEPDPGQRRDSTPSRDERLADEPATGGESRYRGRRSPGSTAQGRHTNRVLRPALTEPETAPMTPQQHEQAVTALTAMIVAWLQRRGPSEDTEP